MKNFIYGVLLILGCLLNPFSIQAHEPAAYYNYEQGRCNVSNLCPCGCGCQAPCYCGCMEGRPCNCSRR